MYVVEDDIVCFKSHCFELLRFQAIQQGVGATSDGIWDNVVRRESEGLERDTLCSAGV